MAVAGGGEAGEPSRIDAERVEIVPLHRGRHRGGRLAGAEAEDAPRGRRRQMRRQHPIRMRGRDRGVEDRAEQGTGVGHRGSVPGGARRRQDA